MVAMEYKHFSEKFQTLILRMIELCIEMQWARVWENFQLSKLNNELLLNVNGYNNIRVPFLLIEHQWEIEQ